VGSSPYPKRIYFFAKDKENCPLLCIHQIAPVVCRLLTFHIWIFSSEAAWSNEPKLGMEGPLQRLLNLSWSINKHVRHWLFLDRSVGFSGYTPVSSTNKTDRHDITEILLKVALNTINEISINLLNIFNEYW
jgi:hypothetical protein